MERGLRMMCKGSLEIIEKEISHYKKNCVVQDQLEAILRRDGEQMSKLLLERLADLRIKNNMIKGWLSLLSEDEEYVIRRRLIVELTWPRIESEHRSIWKEQGREKRTLMRYYKHGLERIQDFIDENNLAQIKLH